jgi:hypothetical protein
MAIFTLTTGVDTFVGGSAGNTVYGTAATLNAGDSLTGGAGTDVLALSGPGTFRVDQLATFTGFEKITLDNATNSFASLTLGSQPIELDATGYVNIFINSSSNWNGSDIINGDPSRSTNLDFGNSGPPFPPPPVTYDLTSNTFSNVNSVSANSDNVTLLINSSETAGIRSFFAFSANDNLVTAASTLDLSNTTVSGLRVSSTNGLGTTFTVKDLGTAFQIAGGPGHDTLIAQGFTLTADQRAAIFVTGSIETITDQSGTYNAPPPSPGIVGLGAALHRRGHEARPQAVARKGRGLEPELGSGSLDDGRDIASREAPIRDALRAPVDDTTEDSALGDPGGL